MNNIIIKHLVNLKLTLHYKYRYAVSNHTPQISPTELSGNLSSCNDYSYWATNRVSLVNNEKFKNITAEY